MKCYNCGNEIPQGAKYCLSCGRKVGDAGNHDSETHAEGDPEHVSQKKSPKNIISKPFGWKIFFGILLILLCYSLYKLI